ncbi:MAG: hypothetical protein HY815_07535 [Candidatus Riflebacteria bacterium]|nr:hypothetical protein [Candidatus Riflebacteria bacterium]
MHEELWELEDRWSDLVWISGLALCPWPLGHPVTPVAVRLLEARRRDLARVARVMARLIGHGTCCESRFTQVVDAAVAGGRWGDSWEETGAMTANLCLPRRATWPEHADPELVFLALRGALRRLLEEVLWARARTWERAPQRVERTSIQRILGVGMVLSWVVQPRWRPALGADSVRSSMKSVVDGQALLDRLATGATPGLERCVVEIHQWLRTGELGQPWPESWQP